MRLVTYLPPDVAAADEATSFALDPVGRAGGLVYRGEGVVIVDVARALGADAPAGGARMLDLVAAGPATWERLADLLTRIADDAADPGEGIVPADGTRLLAPVPAPPMVRDFYAFEEHVRRGFEKRGEPIPDAWYEFPAFYKSNHRAILGPGETVPWPSFTDELDYELEIAMVVGRGGRDLSETDAAAHIFGFTLMNDISARDLQRREMQVRLGPSKSKDFATVLGPVLVTPDEIDVTDLQVRARIDGDLVTDSHTGDMRWSFAQMLAYASRDEDVFPGDVFGSGTVSGGCGLEHGRMLTPGGTIELQARGIGILANPIGHKRAG